MAEILGFNKNRSCIEIPIGKIAVGDWIEFNKNRSCIEIDLKKEIKDIRDSLIRTEVVLKYNYEPPLALEEEV